MSTQCPVCREEYTKKVRTEILCPYCVEGACLSCIKRYILQSMAEPNCLHCKRILTTEVIDGLFTKHFRKTELRRHRIQLLMDQERSLFPQTVSIIEREDAHEAYITAHNLHMSLIHRLSPRDTEPVDLTLIENINKVRKTISNLLQRIAEIGLEINKPKSEKREFIKKCPTCAEGFLSSAWRCTLCKTRVCNHCLAVKGVGIPYDETSQHHECKEDDLKSAKTIQEQTKPCPHCGVRVQKSEGCMQMWCTSCNNAFDWRTGQKVNGPVHNPHFHEFQRNGGLIHHGNENWQINCQQNGDPYYWPWTYSTHLINLISQKCEVAVPQSIINRIAQVNRFVIERVMSARLYTPYNPASYEDLRKRRIRREIDDAAWAKLLSSRETTREKQNRLRLLDELLIAVARDVFGQILQKNTVKLDELQDMIGKTFDAARDYYNQELLILSKDCGLAVESIDENWILRYRK